MADDCRYEYVCSRCGVVTIHGPGGGKLGCGYVPPSDGGLRSGALPECPASGGEVSVTAIDSGEERKSLGTMATLAGVAA